MNFLKTFHLSWDNLVGYVPAIIGGILCFVITIVLANVVSKIVSKVSLKRSKDPLVSNFVGKIVWFTIFILGTVLALGILGLGTISNKILAGAGLTTFVVGFALKDIGENFLAGLILAFNRPYKVGNVIECSGVKGVVKDMTLRQTTVEAINGKIILIPNSNILNNPLTKYANDDNNLRQEFTINVDAAEAKNAVKLIMDTISGFDYVSKGKSQGVKVIIDSLVGDKAKLLVVFWFDINKFKGSRSGSRSDVMFTVIEKLKAANYKFSG